MLRELPTAGTILAAADALRTRRGQGWTDEEVAVLIRLSYAAGATDAYLDDLAELRAVWELHPLPRPSYEERVAARLASYPPPRPLVLNDPDWPPVRVPGAAVQIAHLGVAA